MHSDESKNLLCQVQPVAELILKLEWRVRPSWWALTECELAAVEIHAAIN
jgi:hypothetical protein